MYALKDGMSIQELDNLMEAAQAAKQELLDEQAMQPVIISNGGALFLRNMTIEKQNRKSLRLRDPFGNTIVLRATIHNDGEWSTRVPFEYKK